MNIFWLEQTPDGNAKSLADIHLRKMILEYAQLLSTAHHVLDGEHAIKGIYKKTHVNHPCAVWVRESASNYSTLLRTFERCCHEYLRRFDKVHATSKLLVPLSTFPKNVPLGVVTTPPLCMPDEFKDSSGNLLTSYRNYYSFKSSKMLMKWTNRQEPSWFQRQLYHKVHNNQHYKIKV